MKAEVRQMEGKMNKMEASFVEQYSKATEEVHSLKDLLDQNEVYVDELVQEYTQAKQNLHASSERFMFFKSNF